MKLLEDKVVLVTGAAAGIGAGVARLFAVEGAHVYLTDVDGPGVKQKTSSLESEGGSVFGFVADVRDRDSMSKVVDDAIAKFGHIDVLINNAGVYPRRSFIEMTEDQWDEIQDINVKGVFHCAKLVIPHMINHRSGALVNISSVTFFLGMKDLTHYIASKGAIIGFTRSLAREMGQYNIRVNCITPGAVETEGERAVATSEQLAPLLDLQSLRRRIVPEDIARVCLFLSTELSSGMTGQTLNVDGGWVMH